MVSLNENSKAVEKPAYDRFGRQAGARSTSPTVDAATQAFDERKNSGETDVLQAQFAAAEEMIAEEEQQEQQEEEAQEIISQQANQLTAIQAQQAFQAAELAKTNPKNSDEFGRKSTLPTGWFVVAFLFAVAADTVSIIFNFVPFVGGFISSVLVNPIALAILLVIHKVNGVQFNRSLVGRFAFTAVIEFIPVINILPTFTVLVVVNKIFPLFKQAVEVSGVAPAKQMISPDKNN